MEVYNNTENVKTQMRRGVLEYCILSILSKKDSYASSILSELKNARMIVVEGTIYPLLIRQKIRGCSPTAGRNPLRVPRESIIRSLKKAARPSSKWILPGRNW